MKDFLPFLKADLERLGLLGMTGSSGFTNDTQGLLEDALLIVGIGGAIGLFGMLLVWVLGVSSKREARRRSSRTTIGANGSRRPKQPPTEINDEEVPSRKRRRKRRRNHPRRPTNPTRAETGGLPSKRDDS